jgi:hypothetical protein
MEKRALFPLTMFLLAGASFAYGTWQYLHAQAVQASADSRMAYIMTTIESSGVSRQQKLQMYASIMGGLPSAPGVFGFDFSGSFASQQPDDQCTGDGQRAVCRALKAQGTDAKTMEAICGVCNPK